MLRCVALKSEDVQDLHAYIHTYSSDSVIMQKYVGTEYIHVHTVHTEYSVIAGPVETFPSETEILTV